MAHDRHVLLDDASIESPYAMVGHSFGGRLVRPFVNLYPGDVVSMVLVDLGHEDFPAHAEAALSPEEWQQYRKVTRDVFSRVQEMQGTAGPGPPGDFPLVVLSAPGYIDHHGLSNDVDEELHQVLITLHTGLVGLSPNGTHVMAEGSGRGIQYDRSDLVLDAVRQGGRKSAANRTCRYVGTTRPIRSRHLRYRGKPSDDRMIEYIAWRGATYA